MNTATYGIIEIILFDQCKTKIEFLLFVFLSRTMRYKLYQIL